MILRLLHNSSRGGGVLYINSQAGSVVQRLATINNLERYMWTTAYARLPTGAYKIQLGVNNSDKKGDFFLREATIGNISLCDEYYVYSREYNHIVLVSLYLWLSEILFGSTTWLI